MEHEVRVDVDAPPEVVWDLFVDVERWSEWTKSVSAAERLDEGAFGVGSSARIKQPRMPVMVWQVTSLERGTAFTWETKSAGVTTSAVHRVDAGGDGGSIVILSVKQTGPLAGIVGLLMGRQTRRFVQMEAEGLKRQAESSLGE